MKYYGHTLAGCPPEQWQELIKHLSGTAKRAALFAKPFGASDFAWNCGILHDLGKYLLAFRNYLLQSNGLLGGVRQWVNHANAGAVIANTDERLGLLYSYIVAGHHTGLPNYLSDFPSESDLKMVLEENSDVVAQLPTEAHTEALRLLRKTTLPAFNAEDVHLFARMIFSCLVDADFLDTQSIMNRNAFIDRQRCKEKHKDIDELLDMLNRHMRKFKSDGRIDDIRNDVQKYCRDASVRGKGIFSLTVPTGGGKTLSSMIFALEHAKRHGQERVIYVIPYTSIIEQNADVFRNIFGDEQVVEHHSNLIDERRTDGNVLACENWDAPIVITTNVQFFQSLYGNRYSVCRKLHNIANSVVIMDEAQLIPPKLRAPCTKVIGQLTRGYGTTIVLATATQPHLPGLEITEIVPPGVNLHKKLKRTNIVFPREMFQPVSWEDLAAELMRHPTTLCIVNTRKNCRALYDLMPDDTIHLSAIMCPEHRTAVISEIKRRLSNEIPVRVISTQLIEAGVDIDFKEDIYRALAGFDSIIQAAGRCNREGSIKVGTVHVFVEPTFLHGSIGKGAHATRRIVQMAGFDPDEPKSCLEYFKRYYAANEDGGEWLRKTLCPDTAGAINFKKAAEEFKIIDEDGESVIVKYGRGRELLHELERSDDARMHMTLLRKLQRYCVNLHSNEYQTALARGVITESPYGWSIWEGEYSDSVGLIMPPGKEKK